MGAMAAESVPTSLGPPPWGWTEACVIGYGTLRFHPLCPHGLLARGDCSPIVLRKAKSWVASPVSRMT